jgi:hypothetical protein
MRRIASMRRIFLSWLRLLEKIACEKLMGYNTNIVEFLAVS